ncbi:MAG: HAD family hydrolase [Candidatus Fermentibacteraceae bacterium]|nr:HAD family hydrolase [Candidatus Fermentibacteraceae bacterium]
MKNFNAGLENAKLWIFDADDTLWESGLYFRRAENDFAALMHSLGYEPAEIVSEIHTRDLERLSVTGYGARPYMSVLRSMLEDKFTVLSPYMLTALDDISYSLLHHPLVLLPGVLDSIKRMYTSGKRMIVYTMGEEDHQTDKFKRSGISQFFEKCTVVPIKTEETLRQLLASTGTAPAEACMIGNSPRSDINPAIGCGVNALFVQRPLTWQAEQIEFVKPELVTTVADLTEVLPLAGLGRIDPAPSAEG